jgi:soluble lytic murein transglycosylase
LSKITHISILILSLFLSLSSCYDSKERIEYFKNEIIGSKGKNFKNIVENYKYLDPSEITFDDKQYYYITGKLYYENFGIDRWTLYFLNQGIENENLFQNESLDLLIRCHIEKSNYAELKKEISEHQNLLNPAYKDFLLNFANGGDIDKMTSLPPIKEFFPLYYQMIKSDENFIKDHKNAEKLISYFYNTDLDSDFFKKYENEIDDLAVYSDNNPLLIVFLSLIKKDGEMLVKTLPAAFDYSESPELINFIKQVAIKMNQRRSFYETISNYRTKNKWFKYYYLTENIKHNNNAAVMKEFLGLLNDFPENGIYNYYIRSQIISFNYNFDYIWIKNAVDFIKDYPKSLQARSFLSLIFRSAIYQKKENILIPFLKQIPFESMDPGDQSIYYYLCYLSDKKDAAYYSELIRTKFPLSYSYLTISNGDMHIDSDRSKPTAVISMEAEPLARKINYLLDFDLSDDACKIDYSTVSDNDKKNIKETFYRYYDANERYYEAINVATSIAVLDYGPNLIGIDLMSLKRIFPYYYKAYVDKYAEEFKVEPALCYAVIREESFFNKNAVSWAKAEGLMQIMPSTGKFLADRLKIREYDLKNPDDSIRMGIYYLKTLIDSTKEYQLAIASYNAGQSRINQYLSTYRKFPAEVMYELIPNEETRHYIRKVMRSYFIYKFMLNKENISG